MSTHTASLPTDWGKRHILVSLLLLGGLLFLRFPFLIVAGLVLPRGSIQLTIVTLVFCIGTYLLTAILIWWERERLKDFWFDLAAAIAFLFQMFCFPIGIGLFVAMRRGQAKFPSPPIGVWRWALVGAIIALVCEIFITTSAIEPPSLRGEQTAGFGFLLPAILTQMTWAAVWEEPLFRGFLWGYLRRAHWPNIWIWLFQAALFTLGHIYYLQTESLGPWLIRMLIPSLVLGFIAWQAKSIFASMVTHGMFNASHDMLAHTRSLPEAVSVSWTVAIVILVVLVAVSITQWMIRRRVPNPQ